MMAGVGRGWEVERGCLTCLSLRAIYSVQYVPVAGDVVPNVGLSYLLSCSLSY
jgi:hypothetical protein